MRLPSRRSVMTSVLPGPLIVGLLLSALVISGCGGERPAPLPKGNAAPPPKKQELPPRGPEWLRMPPSARFERYAVIKRTEPGKGIALLARLDLPEKDLPGLCNMNPDLPVPVDIKKDDALFAALAEYEPLADWWRPKQVRDPKCARLTDRTIPQPPPKKPPAETTTEDAPDETAEPKKAEEKPLDPPLHERRWTVSMCIGEVFTGRLRVLIAFDEENPAPAPATDTPSAIVD